ncbi:ribonuclease H-like domain-containing protein [Tanacetum coccineum]
MATRAQVGTVKPTQRLSLHMYSISPVPKSPILALKDPHWLDAMSDEYNALINNNTWVLVPRPQGANVIHSLWLFRHKYHADGSLSRYKALLFANGNNQQLGIDCDETFSSVDKLATIQTVLSLSVSQKWRIHQLDVKNAFLNGDLFVDPRFPSHVCRLQRLLYGLKHAPCAWFQRFTWYATRVGFSYTRCDSSLFIYKHGNGVAYLLIYVDDIVLIASATALLQRIISSLCREFVRCYVC